MAKFRILSVALTLSLTAALPIFSAAEDQPKIKVQRLDKKELIKPDGDGAKPEPAKPEPAKPDADAKKKVEAKISAEAKTELDAISQAYNKLNALDVTGNLKADIDVGGQVQKEDAIFVGTFQAPNKFRHEIKGDVVVGSTGEKLYAFRPAKNDFKSADAPKARLGPSEKLPSPMRDILQMQNPGLLCAIVADAGQFLAEDVTEISKGTDLSIDGKTYTVLNFKGDKESYQVAVDPGTHLVRRLVLDLKKTIEAAGRDDVKKFSLTFDYTSILTNSTPKAEMFAWAAPDGAKDLGAEEAEEGDAVALAGKPAPDFTLNGMDGVAVSLKNQKGSVVILDFWATWCGPCRQSLPGLNKLHKELTGQGLNLKTYAVDLEEPKDKVQPVAAKLCPDLHVLLDEKSEVSKKFGVSGIPQTVVIGKDGKVKKVFIGSGNEAKIRAAATAALKEN